MSRERWTEEDKAKLLRLHEEIGMQYNEIPAGDRYAIIASRIAREGFRPTASAVGSMISTLQRLASTPKEKNGASDHFAVEVPGLERVVESLQDTVDALSVTLTGRNDELLEVAKHALRSFGELTGQVKKQNEMLEKLLEAQSEETKTLDKMVTSLDILCDQMETLVSGLKEAETNG